MTDPNPAGVTDGRAGVREVIVSAYLANFGDTRENMADAILAALRAAGYEIVKVCPVCKGTGEEALDIDPRDGRQQWADCGTCYGTGRAAPID